MKYIFKEEVDNALNDLREFVKKHSVNDKPRNISHIKNCIDTLEERSDNLVYEESLYEDLFSRYNVYWQTLHVIEKSLGLKVTADFVMDNESQQSETKYYIRTGKGDLLAEITENEYKICKESSFLDNQYQDPKNPPKTRKTKRKSNGKK